MVAESLLIVDLRPQSLRLLQTLLKLGLRCVEPRLLVGNTLLVAAYLIAHALQARAERGEHGLLPFQSRTPLSQLSSRGILIGFLSGESGRFGAQLIMPFTGVLSVLLQLPARTLDFFEPLIRLASAILKLLLPLLNCSLKARQASQIGFILRPFSVQGLSIRNQLPFASLVFLPPS